MRKRFQVTTREHARIGAENSFGDAISTALACARNRPDFTALIRLTNGTLLADIRFQPDALPVPFASIVTTDVGKRMLEEIV